MADPLMTMTNLRRKLLLGENLTIERSGQQMNLDLPVST